MQPDLAAPARMTILGMDATEMRQWATLLSPIMGFVWMTHRAAKADRKRAEDGIIAKIDSLHRDHNRLEMRMIRVETKMGLPENDQL